MALKVGELFASFDLDSSGMNATVRTIESSMEALGANMVSMGSKMQSSITAPIESFAKQAISAGMDFTSQMSTVEAISGATAAEMEKLNAEALKMGSTTQFTATQAGEALEYMAMAGWKTDQMLAGLAPIMNLAAASGEDLGTTADIVTDALTAFGLKAEDAGHFSDILAVASSNANTNVSMMGETFKYIAPVAGAFGYKAEDVAVAIGLMANSGIKASQAGTSLRAALSQMAKPSDKAESAMKKLGISITKSNGEIKPFSELVQNLRSSFSGLSEAQKVQYAATIFGQEAMSGMLAIINASDEDIQKLTQSVNECDGATQRMANTVLNNARGDWTLFQSAVEGAQVALFKLNEGAIRSVIQGMTSLVDRFNGASDASKQAALKLALVAAAMGPVMVFGGQMLLTLSRIGVVLGALVSPIGLAATGLALFALAATDAGNTIGTTLEAMASKAAEMLPSVTSHAESAIAEISTRIPELSESLVNGIETMLPAVVESAGGIITAMLDAFTQNADSIMSIGLSIMTSIVNSIASSAPTLIPSAFSAIVSVLTALIDGAPELLESGINLAGKIIEGIKNTDWAAMGTDLMTSITGALESAAAMATEAIKNAVSGIIDAIQAALGIDEGDTLDEIGKKVIDGIKHGMTAAVLTMLDAMKQIGSSIWNGIKTGLGIGEDGGETESAGEALIGKIVTGIENAVSGALDTVKAAVSSIWSTVKSALGLGADGGDNESADNIGFDNAAVAELDETCYEVEGELTCTISIDKDDASFSAACIYFLIGKAYGDAIVDPSHTIPSLTEILSQIEATKSAAKAAQDAAGAANTAAGTASTAAQTANTAANGANTARDNANKASGAANTAAEKINNMTVTADALDTGSEATADLTTADGHYILHLGLPRGATGATPQLTITVQTGEPGTQASVVQSGTAENPVLTLTIPRGDTGNIGNLTVNGKAPDASGAVTLGVILTVDGSGDGTLAIGGGST